MDNLLENFSKNVRVRTKHAKNYCFGLWGQSLILKAGRDDFQGLKKATYEGF